MDNDYELEKLERPFSLLNPIAFEAQDNNKTPLK
jgi:hypothetical protein